MKLSKQLTKKINSPKSLFIFLILIILFILFLHFLFMLIRKIFDMDKKDSQKLNNAEKKASNNTTNSSTNK